MIISSSVSILISYHITAWKCCLNARHYVLSGSRQYALSNLQHMCTCVTWKCLLYSLAIHAIVAYQPHYGQPAQISVCNVVACGKKPEFEHAMHAGCKLAGPLYSVRCIDLILLGRDGHVSCMHYVMEYSRIRQMLNV